ncbi:2-(3-amino-3-carboxypropyl)histidine synthase subunit 2 [Venturia canescens]|uniref:2-(3-amino-3-carboxypropyl)histidine synthase subunit 2 n=1 Tax=Venturia canescens TaxID=32260 RepID=UPI001C9BC5E0|nr:2-(3-amino-3-carboxypropyl)histidine synthase subunit 2 [Venturia canescens]
MTTVCVKKDEKSPSKLETDLSQNKTEIVHNVVKKYDLDKCVEWIKARGLERVCLQFPDSLLSISAQVSLYLEQNLGKKVFILGDTTCGSCCVDEIAANHINADGIVHFGHACLNPTSRLEVFHVLEKSDIDTDLLVQTISEFFVDTTRKYILFYDVAYAHAIEAVQKLLKSKYSMLIVTTLSCMSNVDFTMTKNSPEVLISGRSWTLENGYKIEDYEALYIGKNDKTLASLALSIPAKFWYHTLGNTVTQFEIVANPWLKRRRYLVEKLKDARTVGIVVATLGIKNYLESLNSIKRVLKEKNKKSYIFSVGKLNPAKLANFPEVDAFVVIACPENEIFDSKEFYKPLLTPFEVELAFNSSRSLSTHYCLDFRQILPGGANYVEFKTSEETDVSLITGELRSSEKEVFLAETMNALSQKEPGTMMIGKAGASFLNERTWKGVEQRLGEDEIKPAEKGRSGLPISYANEQIYR